MDWEPLVQAAAELPILVCNLAGEREELLLSELFPQPFRLPAQVGG